MAKRALIKASEDGWKPVRHGKMFCSPRCGAGCTYAAFTAATAAANAHAQRMGAEWQPRIWENMGWHWTVDTKAGYLGGHPYGSLTKIAPRAWRAEIYAGTIAGPHKDAMSYAMQFFGNGTNPKQALEDARNKARFAAQTIEHALNVTGRKS